MTYEINIRDVKLLLSSSKLFASLHRSRYRDEYHVHKSSVRTFIAFLFDLYSDGIDSNLA